MNVMTIAQLVERETVETLLSLGHWFDSGWSDFLGGRRARGAKTNLSNIPFDLTVAHIPAISY